MKTAVLPAVPVRLSLSAREQLKGKLGKEDMGKGDDREKGTDLFYAFTGHIWTPPRSQGCCADQAVGSRTSIRRRLWSGL